jgi:hypothetical protein
LTSITIGPSLTGLRGTWLTGSIIYTLVTGIKSSPPSLAKDKATVLGPYLGSLFSNLGSSLSYAMSEVMHKLVLYYVPLP